MKGLEGVSWSLTWFAVSWCYRYIFFTITKGFRILNHMETWIAVFGVQNVGHGNIMLTWKLRFWGSMARNPHKFDYFMFDCVVYCWRHNEMASYNEADHHNHRSNIDYMYLFRTQWYRMNKRLHPRYPVGCNYLSMSYTPSFPTHILSMMTSSNGNISA